MEKKVTLSVIKADVGSIGGHTKPSEKMLHRVKELMKMAVETSLLIDGVVVYTGDDICLIMSHVLGVGATHVHRFAWDCFKAATSIAQEQGCYGAGQDLLVNAPAGNVRGAGPAVAEIEFILDKESKDRPAEAFLVFAADKCGPGAYNLPLYQVFCDPMHNGGILLSPKLHQGFVLQIIDMDHKSQEGLSSEASISKAKDGDRIIRLNIPERIWDAAVLLRDMDRFAIESIYSRYKPDEQVASVSATRLHNIAGKYTGKDDPVAIVRTQGIFPAPEECVEPYYLGHFVTGDARGSHVMPIMPIAINTAVAGPYCQPLVSCLAFSMNQEGKFSYEMVDLFGNQVWEATRQKISRKAEEFRRQGFFGATMASHQELSYTGIVDSLAALDKEFIIRASV